MQIEIRSRHFTLGEEQREKITADLEKLERFSPRPPVSARMTLVNEKGRFAADLAFFLKNNNFRTKVDSAVEPELAADEAIENIKSQLQRFKGKIVSRQKGEEGGLGKALLSEADTDLGAPEPQPEEFKLEDMSLERALKVLGESDRPFLVFRNVDNARLNVVYLRKNGEYGLLEPTEE